MSAQADAILRILSAWLDAGEGSAAHETLGLEAPHAIVRVEKIDGRVVIHYVTPTTPARGWRETHRVSGATLVDALAQLAQAVL